MSLKLYHISEEDNIAIFYPRISKKQWNYEKYVWAIEEEKLHNYLLPRDCPRICVDLEEPNTSSNWLGSYARENQKAIIFVPENRKEQIQNCTLFKYEFLECNFKIIDKIAGYYVSTQPATPINKTTIKHCKAALEERNVSLEMVSTTALIKIRAQVVEHWKMFSIIKWSNLEL